MVLWYLGLFAYHCGGLNLSLMQLYASRKTTFTRMLRQYVQVHVILSAPSIDYALYLYSAERQDGQLRTYKANISKRDKTT